MNHTTKDIIKLLPFEDAFKTELLNSFDSFDPDVKFTVERIIWDTYDMLFELNFEANIQLAFQRATKNEEVLDETLYKRIREQTEQQMHEEGVHEVESEELQEARVALEKIVREMKAAGMDLKN